MAVCFKCLFVAAIAFTFMPPAWAQGWPVKPIRLIVNFPAGGTTDLMARVLTPGLSETLGQPIIIENRGGAAGNIGIEAVVRSAPDGYTFLLSAGSPIVVGPHLYKLNFDVSKDLVPVAPLGRTTMMLVVRSGLPIRSVAELIAYARANPGKLNYGSSGSGTTPHLHGERMVRAAKINATHVPYKGVAQTITALLGDQIDFTFDSGSAIQHVKANKLRVVAVLSSERSPTFPDTPTLSEAGIEVDAEPLFGIYAPAGTSAEIVTRLNREIARIMQTATARAALASIGAEVFTASPSEFAALQHRDRERQGAFIREANISIN